MFRYYNANPCQRHVNDCTVRAISLATNKSWDQAYQELSQFARAQCIMPDDVIYIDKYLDRHFQKIFYKKKNSNITVGEFVDRNPYGTYLITMNGHITCAKNGVIYDTFDPSNMFIWGVYKVR